ncbi:hypothetical protein [Wolbachia endosymbiont (group A) of Lasioglossum malachurum]|uniref:hypothetical protein n=1 Tax=Wolbachia endosymbiont (group A) of Lasioglossum malachurum TaxID=2954024 RepID=UPI00221E38A8|nr:hypothetical protein [Wolbachia endosymbiont (group A) of Lasioglossum malachurum]
MVAALSRRKIVAPLTFEGHCNMDIFNGWFEQFLAPILEPVLKGNKEKSMMR